MSFLWTLNSAKHSVLKWFQSQLLLLNCAENQGSWNGRYPMKPRALHQKLLLYASNSISLASRKDIFTAVFLSFRGRSRKGCRRKIPLCKIPRLDFGGMTAPSYPGSLVCRRRRCPKNVWCLNSLPALGPQLLLPPGNHDTFYPSSPRYYPSSATRQCFVI